MALYCGIDLHARDHVVVVIDEKDRVILEKRQPNDVGATLRVLEGLRSELEAVAVESTFNWYWLVDGLEEAGYEVKLVNTSAVEQYKGLKYKDDRHDARWLAHLMRLGLLPTGYIQPKEDRSVRDLLRQRMRLVRQRTANVLSLKNLLAGSQDGCCRRDVLPVTRSSTLRANRTAEGGARCARRGTAKKRSSGSYRRSSPAVR